ncbi:DNA polymerase alpha, subunit B [Hypoxylon rubiginosum]|uniref:DNA polymerase alpha, subunit B n=1 Tax=Hypoxylon rubiginosum TaxID=110542 RepID=A0ACC0DEB9_9PEZI|nr:DNA polymerase alpha, subunit B [Hypoxylon rubiginosum]
MAEADLEELNELFGMPNKKLEPDVIAELQSIMRIHSLSIQDLYFKWESYSIKMDMDGNSLSLETVRALKQDILDALERSNRSHHVHVKTEKRSAGTPRTVMKSGGDVYGMLEGMVPNTPATGKLNKSATKRRHPLETPSMTRVKGNIPSSSPDHKSPMRLENQLDLNSTPAASFNDRARPGEVIEVLNDHLKPPEPTPHVEPRIKLTATSDQKKLGYKTLAMKTSEASEILDDRIDEFVGYLRDYKSIDENEFGSAASQSTTEIVAVGRIVSDSSEGKLNEASLLLETSRRTGGGKRIHLNLQQLSGRYHFFPGQIVAFRGINSSGNQFAVKEVLEMPLLPNAASTPEVLETHLERLRGGPDAMESDDEPAPLSMIFGSGPYTADDNLDFEPLHALCSQAADTHADALILTGPFVDVDHPLIATGDFDLPEEASVDPDTATMSTVFKYMISPALNRLVSLNSSITILLIPSVRDVIAKHVSWPQDLLPRKDLGLHKNARIIGNPMTLAMNEMVLGISSQDILWDLRHEELVGGRPADSNIVSRSSKYVIEQRHYFPIFPPVDRQKLLKVGAGDGLPTGAMLDTSYLKLGEMVNVRPDVVVLPSALPPFAKVVESVLVINPGYLSKRRGAGTYARMTLFPLKLEDEEVGNEGRIGHQVFKRARVEITRI